MSLHPLSNIATYRLHNRDADPCGLPGDEFLGKEALQVYIIAESQLAELHSGGQFAAECPPRLSNWPSTVILELQLVSCLL